MMPSASEPDAALDQSEEVGAIRDLTAAVAGLSNRSAGDTNRVPRREVLPNATGQADSSQLAAAVDRLTKTVEQWMARGSGISSRSAPEVMLDSVASPKVAAKNRARLVRQDEATMRSQHQLWSLKRLVATYGNPTKMSTGQVGKLYVYYNDETSGVRVQFGFHDGFVIYVDKSQRRR